MNALVTLGLVGTLALGAAGSSSAEGITTVGMYPFKPVPSQLRFLKACGYNLLQYWDTGFTLKPELLDGYYAGLAKEVRKAQKDGFKVWILLSSNMRQWTGPADQGPGAGLRFYPRDRKGMDERLGYIAKAAKALSMADGFTIYAGDPGGVPKALGPSDVHDWISMCREVEGVVRREAPKSLFNVNPWAVTQWEDEGMDVFAAEFWTKESSNSRAVVEEKGFVGPDCGIEFCPHNYYRSLALSIFAKDGITPDLYPNREAVETLKARGTKRLWSWPYFLTDEVDDGYVGPDGVSYGQTQAETRYLHKIISDMRGIGLNGVIANGSEPSMRAEALNTFAFARFCNDPSATPEGVIDEYASYLADGATAPTLGQVIRFIENHSTWQNGLPESSRLPNFECSIRSADMALAKLAKVVPNPNPAFALPEPPADYLKRLERRLKVIARQ